jgi:hypothetical protein
MTDRSVDSVWWEEIHGPRTVKAEIYKALCGAKSVVLVGKAIPWSEKLRSLIGIDLQTFGIYIEEISDAKNVEDPANYLLERFGKPDDRNNYREGKDPSLPKYIKNIRALANKFICISGITSNNCKSWETFLNGFKPERAEDGVFLFEVSTPPENIVNINRISVIDIASKISFYDVLSFSMLLSSTLKMEDIWKQYIAWITSLLYEKNIESLADVYSDCLFDCSINDIHTVLKDRIKDDNLFEKSIWTAQVKIFFPMIEELRIAIINQHKDKIEKYLQSGVYEYCDKQITDPYDAELGFLVYLSAKSKGNIFSYEVFKNISFLHDCRNQLAHINYCDVSTIQGIISLWKIEKSKLKTTLF